MLNIDPLHKYIQNEKCAIRRINEFYSNSLPHRSQRQTLVSIFLAYVRIFPSMPSFSLKSKKKNRFST